MFALKESREILEKIEQEPGSILVLVKEKLEKEIESLTLLYLKRKK